MASRQRGTSPAATAERLLRAQASSWPAGGARRRRRRRPPLGGGVGRAAMARRWPTARSTSGVRADGRHAGGSGYAAVWSVLADAGAERAGVPVPTSTRPQALLGSALRRLGVGSWCRRCTDQTIRTRAEHRWPAGARRRGGSAPELVTRRESTAAANLRGRRSRSRRRYRQAWQSGLPRSSGEVWPVPTMPRRGIGTAGGRRTCAAQMGAAAGGTASIGWDELAGRCATQAPHRGLALPTTGAVYSNPRERRLRRSAPTACGTPAPCR